MKTQSCIGLIASELTDASWELINSLPRLYNTFHEHCRVVVQI